MTSHRAFMSPGIGGAGGAADPDTYTAALERAMHETLLALVALNQQKQELWERLSAIRQLTVRPGTPGEAVREIRHMLTDVPE